MSGPKSSTPIDKSAIRDAATVIVVRDAATTPKILMGQRGSKAAFMPSKYVFPGGAVDIEDADIALAATLSEPCHERLTHLSALSPESLAVAGIRELWEETGLILGHPGAWPSPPPDWQSFAATGHIPTAQALRFAFRAITPTGRPRRFDARFFLLDAAEIASDLDDFSQASEELSHIHWVSLNEALNLNLPFITTLVLEELAGMMPNLSAPESVPFFQNDDRENLFTRIR
ncbi:MAG: NUDIX hydrolase [Pseudomonadota bacterium]